MIQNKNDEADHCYESLSLSRSKKGHAGFILDLPFDIVTMIFSYLDQKDCLRCMNVSRTWNKYIPQYSKNIWKSVRFGKRGFKYLQEAETDKNKYWEQCVDDHVKYVTFDTFQNERRFYDTMRKLIELGCNKLESIGK